MLVLAYHGKVRDGSKGDDEGSDDVVETSLHWDGPGHTDESDHGNDHHNEDNPVIPVSIAASLCETLKTAVHTRGSSFRPRWPPPFVEELE